MNDEHLGRGMAFHTWTAADGRTLASARIGPRGGIEEAAGVAKIEQSIRIILGTAHGERAMRPTFGCNLRSLVFAPDNDATANLARQYVLDGLTRWEPRIEVIDVVVDRELVGRRAGILRIDVRYRIRSTQATGSLVHPFYLEPRPV